MNESWILNNLGETHEDYYNAVVPPIAQTSNFISDTVEEMRKAFAGEFDVYIYSRGHNPTVNILREKLAALDGAEDALVMNSGSSAIFCSVLPFVKQGAHIVSVANPYTWAKKMFDVILPRFGVTTTYIDGSKIENWANAALSQTTLFYLESPNSWTYELQDIAAVAQLAKSKGITTIIDNSYCTPLHQQPLKLGIDLVIQSASKYVGGHSDVIGGIISGSRKLIAKIFYSEYMTTGAGCTPFHAWLLLRGLRTLPIRLQRSFETGCKLVEWLKTQSWVEGMIFPWDNDFPQAKLARQQMQGANGLFTFSVKAKSADHLEDFCNNLKAFKMAVSWGGHESLIIPKIASMPREEFDLNNIVHRQIRMYAGLEDLEYLKQDLSENAGRLG